MTQTSSCPDSSERYATKRPSGENFAAASSNFPARNDTRLLITRGRRTAARPWSAWFLGDAWVGFGALLLGAVVPFTLVVILPTNKHLLEPSLDPSDTRTTTLLIRWGRLHAVRSVLSNIAFAIYLLRLGVR